MHQVRRTLPAMHQVRNISGGEEIDQSLINIVRRLHHQVKIPLESVELSQCDHATLSIQKLRTRLSSIFYYEGARKKDDEIC